MQKRNYKRGDLKGEKGHRLLSAHVERGKGELGMVMMHQEVDPTEILPHGL
jgi:hypothetical protein